MSNSVDMINQEVRIRMLEETNKEIKTELKSIKQEIQSQFKWVIGTILGLFATMITMFGSVVLAKII